MEIINVVVQLGGVATSIESFLITDTNQKQRQIDKAECLFEDWCNNNGYSEEDDGTMQDLLDNGFWESSNYDSISLIWSNVNL